jgi:chromosome partitioning protein
VLKTSICQRVAFAESAGHGQSVFETSPDSQAGDELTALVNEVLEFGA